MTNSGALRNLIAEAADRTGAPLAALSDATRAALAEALKQSDITNPLDTKRTIPTGQYVGLPRRAGERARSRHRAHRRGAAARRRRRAPRRQPARARSRGAARRRSSASRSQPSRRSSPSTTEYGRMVRAQIPSVPVMRDLERTLRVVRALAQSHRDSPRAPAGCPRATSPASCAQRAAALDRSDRPQRGGIRSRCCAPMAFRSRRSISSARPPKRSRPRTASAFRSC